MFGAETVHAKTLQRHFKSYPKWPDVEQAFGVLLAAQQDYEKDALFDVKRSVEADVFNDFLEQAEHLFDLGYYQPAAVIAGGVLAPLRGAARRHRHPDGELAQHLESHMHLRRPMLVVLPHGPRHLRQGGQEAAIDGRQGPQGRLLGHRPLGADAAAQLRNDLLEHGRVEHLGRFTERAQGGAPDPEAALDLGQRRRLLQPPQTGHRRAKEVQQQQGRVLIVEQLPVAGMIPLGPGGPELGEERPEQAKVFAAVEVVFGHGSALGGSHRGFPPQGMSLSHQRPPVYPHLPKFVQQHSCRTVLGRRSIGELIMFVLQAAAIFLGAWVGRLFASKRRGTEGA